MDSADYNELNNLYNKNFLLEGKQEDIDDLQKLHDNPDTKFAIKNYDSVEAYRKMLKKKIDDLLQSESEQRPADEESAEELDGDGPDSEGVDELVDNESEDKNKKRPKKESKNINNLSKVKVMTEDKSIFDKLFEQVMGEAEDEDIELGIDVDGADDEGLGVEEDGDVTITLDRELATKLHGILMDALDVDGEEGEEDAGDETQELEAGYEEDSDPFEEENKHTNDGAKPGVDPSDGGGKTTEPAGDSLGGKSSGTGNASATDKVGSKDTGAGKKTGHDPSGLTSPAKKVVKK